MNNVKRGLSILIFILIVPAIYGIGVGLWVEEINFEPNLNQNFNAFVNNNMGYDAKVRLSARGGLGEYVTFSDEYLEIPEGERGFFTFNLKLPESIPPGRNRIDIGAEDVTPTTGGGISAKTAAYMGFYIRAPYPGKYVEASFRVGNIGKDEVATFDVDIINRGNETINKIGGIIEMFDKDSKVDALTIDPIFNIKPSESRTLRAEWDSTGQSVGEYNAKAHINYDGEELELDTNFKIGELLVKIINYTKEFYKDGINRFDVEIESFWNMDIDNVYGRINVEEQGIETLRTKLGAWSKKTITAYLNTDNLAVGEHIANIKVYYEDKVAEETGNITVLPKREIEMPSKISSTTILLIAIIVLLVIGNIILILHFIRHEKTAKKKKLKK